MTRDPSNRSPLEGIAKRPKAKATIQEMGAAGITVAVDWLEKPGILIGDDLSTMIRSREQAEAVADALLILADQVWPEGEA